MFIMHISSIRIGDWLKRIALDLTTLDLTESNLKTADGDTLLELICQSELCLSKLSTEVIIEWLNSSTAALSVCISSSKKLLMETQSLQFVAPLNVHYYILHQP